MSSRALKTLLGRIAALSLLILVVCILVLWQHTYTTTAKAQSTANLKLLVILVNFPDRKSQPLSTTTAQFAYFNEAATTSLTYYFTDASEGRIHFTGDVAGWFTLASTSAEIGCSFYYLTDAADQAAIKAGYDLSKYQYIQVFSPVGCAGFSGQGEFGPIGVYPPPVSAGLPLHSIIVGTFYVAVFAHELGHNLGESHAATPGPPPNYYGDGSDVMGNIWGVSGYKPMLPNAPHRINLGWIDTGEVQTISANATTTINALETNTGLRILKIAMPAQSPYYYYLSWRQAIGTDFVMSANYLNGVNMHYWSPTGGYTWFARKLTEGAAFTDTNNSITVKQLSHTADTVTLSVALNPDCVRGNVNVTAVPIAQAYMGTSTTATVTIKNQDGDKCSALTYRVVPTYPVGWSGVTTPSSSFSLTPGASKTVTITATPNSTSTVGSYYYTNYDVVYGSPSITQAYTLQYYLNPASCVAQTPYLAISNYAQTALPGTPVAYKLTLNNNDGPYCTTSTWSMTSTQPSGWSTIFSSPTVIVNAGTSTVIIATTTSLGTARNATSTITFKGTDSKTSAHAITQIGAYGVYTPPPVCVRATSTLTATPTSYTVTAGTPVVYTLTVTNKDSTTCAGSIFHIVPDVPITWPERISAPTFTLAPGASKVVIATTTSPSNTPSGTTTIQMVLTDASTTLHNIKTPVQYVTTAPVCTRVAPTLTATPMARTVGPGVSTTYAVTLTHKDSNCSAATYTFAASAPTGWTTKLSLATATMSTTGNTKQVTLTAASPSSSESGTTTLRFLVSDGQSTVHTTNLPLDYGIPPSPLTCTRSAPSFSLSPASLSGTAGDILSYTASLTNKDSSACSVSTFNLSGPFSPTWNVAVSPATLLLSSGSKGNAQVNITSSAKSTVGTYTLDIVAGDNLNVHTATASVDYVISSSNQTQTTIPDSASMSISSTRARKGESATLSWWISSGIAPGVHCSISPASQIQSGSIAKNGDSTSTGWGSSSNPMTAVTMPINSATVFTLTCFDSNGSVSKSTTAGIIPVVQ